MKRTLITLCCFFILPVIPTMAIVENEGLIPNIKKEVLQDEIITLDETNRIRLEDESLEGSTSRLAQILAVKFGYADVARQGPRWWLYQGQTLLAIREELEND